ncbi:ankyrin repeat domain-containing protein [Geobacter grbiciae]|uniref:ankyrin repeat domain-containing protein n=1 Tax=Geobacter grbiciae TaxID=155042 RepID=UPI001C0184C3|nr:ankyrin repeat domain-containing protein [Geobacter grbiciae]MBT1075622.1 ankyrin repeat domain-containing protein [Geobacter grbiciae]
MDPVRRMIRRKAAFLITAVQIAVLLLGMPGLAASRPPKSQQQAPKQSQQASKPPTAPAPAPPVEQQPAPSLFTEATFLLPKGAKVSPRWVLPPTEKARTDAIFSVSAAGAPVVAFSGDSDTYHLLYPDRNYLVAVNAAISGMTHLSNGVLLLSSGNDLLLLAEPREKTLDKKGVPRAALQPVTKVPLHKIDVLTSVGTTVYCAGIDARSGRHALYLLRSLKGGGILDMELAYESGEPITAVTGDAEALYVAKGRTVVRYSVKDGSETTFYTHPSASVTGLDMTPAGLAVSTGREIVLAGQGGALEIMRSSRFGHRMAMAGDTLYVLFNTSLGVLALDNLADLRRFNLAVRPVASGEAAPSLAIAGVSFYESDTLDNTRGFAESFDRKDVRRIVARIEFDRASLSRSRGGHSVTVSWHEPTGGMLKSANYQVTQSPGDPLLAAIGGKTEHGYSPPHWMRNGAAFIKYTDELGGKYPGRYRMRVQVDGIPAGEWSFTLAGQPDPWQAISYDDMATLTTLLDQGLNPNATSESGEPLLSVAVQFGSVSAVQLLLERGANPNAVDKEGKSPLARAEYAGDWRPKAELLVRRGANVNVRRFPGGPPLVTSYSPDFTAFLLKSGADFRYEMSYGKQSLLSEMSDSICTDEILSLLLQRGADLNETDSIGQYTPLGSAIFSGREKCMQLLLEKRASTAVAQRQPNRPPRSALYVALNTLDGRKDPKDKIALRRMVRLLLQKGATLRPGKKLATSAFFDISRDDYIRQMDETRSINEGEGRIMFLGEGPSFFGTVDMIRTLEQDDAALEAATDSKDPAIRELALGTHLARVRELAARARNQYDMGYEVHKHCVQAFKLSEAGYRPAQVDIVPEMSPPQAGGQGKPQMGLKLLKRAEGGAYVQGVVPGSPAERSGVQAGDIILALDTQKMKDVDEVLTTVARLTPGMPVRVTFLRDEPMRLPDLQLTCGLVEYEYQDHWGYAEMNLSRWLAAHPAEAVSDEVRERLKDSAAGGRK